MPARLHTWSELDPANHAVEGRRGLLLGGPVSMTLLWAANFLAVCGPAAVAADRRHS